MATILEVKNLDQHFPILGGILRRVKGYVFALNKINLKVEEGETLGVVGESGCGKSTLAKAIVRLNRPSAGDVYLNGKEISRLEGEDLKVARRQIQMIFQDPYGSLNPRKTVESILAEPLKLHRMVSTKADIKKSVIDLMKLVGLPADNINRFPHEFSGGQRQRIGIARALALRPKVVIADEPVSALDVSIQSQILNLLNDLKKELGLTYIFIAHDLAVVKYIADRIAVMYLGNIVELRKSSDLFDAPLHPYTQALLKSIPAPNPHKRGNLQVLEGDVPSPKRPPAGCAFSTRCLYATQTCHKEKPPLEDISGEAAGKIACFNYKSLTETKGA